MKRKVKIWLFTLLFIMLSGCQKTDIVTEAPDLKLRDTLSSTLEYFSVSTGNCSWNYKKGKDMVGYIACGSHPLEEAKIKEPLQLKYQNKQDYVPYEIYFDVIPDEIIVMEYDSIDIDNVEKEPIATYVLEEDYLELHIDKVYVFNVMWNKDDLDTRGFYGEASYVLVTE